MEQDMSEVSIEEVIKGYVKLRDKKNKMKREHSEELAPINEKMTLVEGWLMRDLISRKVQSQKTAEGTAFLQKSTSATVKDRDAFLDFVRKNKMWDLLENRVAKSVVVDHLENTGEVIPGVNFEQTQVVRIRR
jgi:hypothetical protein